MSFYKTTSWGNQNYIAQCCGIYYRPHMINSDPEYIRPADAKRFGLSRSTIYNLAADGSIVCRMIRRPGAKKPIRLISVESIRKFIEGCPKK